MAIVSDRRMRYSRRGGYQAAYGGFGNGGGVEYGTDFSVVSATPTPEPPGPSPLDYITAGTKLFATAMPLFVPTAAPPAAAPSAKSPAAAAAAMAKPTSTNTYLIVGAGVLGLAGIGLYLRSRR